MWTEKWSQFAPQMWEHQAICHGYMMRAKYTATQMTPHLPLVKDSSKDALFKVVQLARGSHMLPSSCPALGEEVPL